MPEPMIPRRPRGAMDAMPGAMHDAPPPDAGPLAEQDDRQDDPGAPDLTQGYTVTLSVLPDGQYRVGRPVPLAAPAPQAEGEERAQAPASEGPHAPMRPDAAGAPPTEDFPTLTAALKGLMGHVVANPVAASEQSAFESGFGPSEPERMQAAMRRPRDEDEEAY